MINQNLEEDKVRARFAPGANLCLHSNTKICFDLTEKQIASSFNNKVACLIACMDRENLPLGSVPRIW